jgi:hypothetical protein
MEILKILSSILLFIYPLYCVIREVISINKGDILTPNQRKVRFSILIYLCVFHLILFYWAFNKKELNTDFNFYNINQELFLFLLIFAQLSSSITRHFRKERKGEDLLLNYRNEFKRTMTFKFSKVASFELVVLKFIEEQKNKGIEIEIIKDTPLDVEPFKFLKKGDRHTFSEKTWLEKMSDDIEHNYTYNNNSLVVFGMHLHLKFSEQLTAISYDIELYIVKRKKLVKIIIKIGDTYIIPEGVKHGVIFGKIGKIGLKWN